MAPRNVLAAWNDARWTRCHRGVLGIIQKHRVASYVVTPQAVDRVMCVIVAIFVQRLCTIWEVDVIVSMKMQVVVGSKDRRQCACDYGCVQQDAKFGDARQKVVMAVWPTFVQRFESVEPAGMKIARQIRL